MNYTIARMELQFQSGKDFDPHWLMVAVADGKILGTVAYCVDTDDDGDCIVRFARLYVDPSSWRRGIASALLNEVEDTVRPVGGFAACVVERRDLVEGFYRRRGYRPDPEWENNVWSKRIRAVDP